jgi:hypothetical protein
MLEDAVIAWSKANKKHEAVEVFIYAREDVYLCEVVRGDPMKRVVEIRDGHRSALDFRPAVSDHIRYEPATGRISIATRAPRLREIYKRLLGSMLAGDETFFSDSSVCNLRPLQDQGAELFARLPPDILRVHVTELRWQRGGRDRLAVYGRDCFDVLDDLGARLSEGHVTEAKLKIYFVGDPPRADVVLRAPNRIEISGSGFRDEVIRRLLSEVGIRGSAPGSFAALDTWSLFPYRHHLGLWRQRLGSRCDASVGSGTLRAVILDGVAKPDAPPGTPELAVEQLPDGQRLGVSLEPPTLRTLTATDYSGYELNWAVVAQAIARAAGLSGPVRAVESWLWQVGQRTLGSAHVNVMLATRLPPAEAALVMKQHAGGTRPVLIVPQDCTCRPDITPIVRVDPFASAFTDVLPRVVSQLGLQHEVPVRLWCSEELVLDTTTGRAWFGDQELPSLAKQPFDFAVLVARGRGQVVPKNLLNDKLSPSRPDDATARQAKAAFLRAVKASYQDAGMPWPANAPDIFPSQGGGYLLNCSAYVHPPQNAPVSGSQPVAGQ